MFEEYLQDASEFFELARQAHEASDDRKARRYYRAGVFYASGGIEAFVNYIADSLAKADNLTPIELAFLNDQRLHFVIGTMSVEAKTEFHRLDEKLRILLKRFSPTFDFNDANWSKLMEFKNFRDSLVHPRNQDQAISLEILAKNLKNGIESIIVVMNVICLSMFKKPLRKQLLDLLPT